MNDQAHDELRHATFRTASYSGATGQCVEIARTTTMLGIRDSKLADSPVLAVTAAQGQAFLDAVTSGRLDLPA